MKKFLLFTVLCISTLSIAQTPQFSGKYEKRTNTNAGSVFEYTLDLKADGTFAYHFYRNIDATQPEENLYGKGTWKADKKSVLFTTNKATDINEKYTLDFTGSKARFVKKRVWVEGREIKKTYFLFYDSDLRTIKGLKLSKSTD